MVHEIEQILKNIESRNQHQNKKEQIKETGKTKNEEQRSNGKRPKRERRQIIKQNKQITHNK